MATSAWDESSPPALSTTLQCVVAKAPVGSGNQRPRPSEGIRPVKSVIRRGRTVETDARAFLHHLDRKWRQAVLICNRDERTQAMRVLEVENCRGGSIRTGRKRSGVITAIA